MPGDRRRQRSSKKATARRESEGSLGKGGLVNNVADNQIKPIALNDAGARTKVKPPSEPTVTPDDFASALQRTVDDLQTRLACLTNPITNFAVKEFRIDTPVIFSVTRLGTVLYRFLSSDEDVEPEVITRISLTLVPIEKQSCAGSLPTSLFKLDTRIEELTGIDIATVETLRQQRIYTASDLWRVGSRASARVELESLLKIDREKLSNLISEAELLLVKGIGTAEAQVLFKIGVKSLAALSKLNPDELAQKFNQSAGRTGLQLSPAVAATWIKSARSYVGIMKGVISENPAKSSA